MAHEGMTVPYRSPIRKPSDLLLPAASQGVLSYNAMSQLSSRVPVSEISHIISLVLDFQMSSIKHSELDMGLFFPTTFKKSHNLPTPPISPVAHPLKRQASRFRLPKLLKRSQTVDNVASVDRNAPWYNHKSSERSKCLKQDESTSGRCLVSREAEKPLPPVLPAIPTSRPMDVSLTRTTSKKLKKMPKSYQNLRAYKSENELSVFTVKPAANPPTLLPSPLLSDSETAQNVDAFCAFRNPRGLKAVETQPTEGSCGYEDIVSGYCEDVFQASRRQPENNSNEASTPVTSSDVRPPATSNMSAALRSPKRDRSSSLSSEAIWLSKSFAHQDYSTCAGQLEKISMNEKSLAEKSRRCCHLVQGPNFDLPRSWTGERKAVGHLTSGVWFCNVADLDLVICYCHQARESERHLGPSLEFCSVSVCRASCG
jgi:hypothetical protein